MYVSAKELHREFDLRNSDMRRAILWFDRTSRPGLSAVAKRLRKIKQAILDREYAVEIGDDCTC